MKSVDNLIKLADRLARKLSLAQIVSDDPKAVVVDAFLGPHEENAFMQFILAPTSHFSKVLPESINTVDIGAMVDAQAKAATFLVNTSPAAPLALKSALINALREDYKAKYGKYPQERFIERLAKGDIRPPDVKQSVIPIIQIK
jgi:hypothetical protein